MNLEFKHLEFIHPRSLKHLSSQLQLLVKGRLWLKVLVAMILGVLVGVLLGPTAGFVSANIAKTITSWLAVPGQIFLVLVQMIVVPLVIASIIRGIAASENIEYLKRTGSIAVVFFLVTTVLAIVIGIVLATVFDPGSMISPDLIGALSLEAHQSTQVAASLQPTTLPDTLVSMIPKNPLGSMVNLEMLQVVTFSIIIGVAMVSLQPKQALPLLELLGTIQQVCMTVVKWAMKIAPIAVFGLMTNLASKVGVNIFVGLSAYVGTVILGLFIMNVIYVLIYKIATGQPGLKFIRAIREVQLLAFSTSSSAAVMPLSIKTAEEKLGVRPSISQFVIPLGATVNMNGTALYQGVATIFLAQVFNIDLDLGALSLLVVTAVGSSIGSPATPGVGIMILAMVLSSVGVPTAGIGLIMGVDRILDMSRTAVNVAGDLVAAAILNIFVAGDDTAETQLNEEKVRDQLRLDTGVDIVLED